MATIGSNFMKFAAGIFRGASIVSATAVSAAAIGPNEAAEMESGGGGVVVDKFILDPSLVVAPATNGGVNIPISGKIVGNFAKNGVALITMTGTTPVTIDLTDLTSATTASAGDTSFANIKALHFQSLGAAVVTIAPGGSNPSSFPLFSGTTPTLSLPLNGDIVVYSPAGATVDGTHKTILLTPSAGGTIAVYGGGA